MIGGSQRRSRAGRNRADWRNGDARMGTPDCRDYIDRASRWRGSTRSRPRERDDLDRRPIRPTSGRRPWRRRRPSHPPTAGASAEALWCRTTSVTSSSAARWPRCRATASRSAGPIAPGPAVRQVEPAGGLQQARFAEQLPGRVGGLAQGIGVKHDQIAAAERHVERLVARLFVEPQRQVAARRFAGSPLRQQRPGSSPAR